mmetsp:Transcript_12083/g.18669  ORF Transcript_12083/g.18669 Transcript_12083/m.18669 type:complete len:183 (-) Transcript_12083:2302-2850(-)
MAKEMEKLFRQLNSDLASLGLRIVLSDSEKAQFLAPKSMNDFEALHYIERHIRDVLMKPNYYFEQQPQLKEPLNYFELDGMDSQMNFLKPFIVTKYQGEQEDGLIHSSSNDLYKLAIDPSKMENFPNLSDFFEALINPHENRLQQMKPHHFFEMMRLIRIPDILFEIEQEVIKAARMDGKCE